MGLLNTAPNNVKPLNDTRYVPLQIRILADHQSRTEWRNNISRVIPVYGSSRPGDRRNMAFEP
jgi:hypothetical protein